MSKRKVQLLLPATQDMQEDKGVPLLSSPPQTTNLPPDRSERVCVALG